MRKNIELLLKLQDVDYDLGELERSKYYLPDMIKNLEKEIEDTETILHSTEEELKEKNLTIKRLEGDLQVHNTELEKLQKQMKFIKTNREYDALTNEMANHKLKISEIEEQILQMMTNVDELRDKIEEYKKKLSEVRENNTAQLAHLREELGSIEDKIKMKQGERKNIAMRIDKKILATYERVKKGKREQVVVAIRKRACSGCYKSLPPQRIQEIKMEEEIITCDNCGRVLVWLGDD